MLQGEMDAHLTGCQPTETPPEEVAADELPQVPNKRNGFSHKTLKTEFGPLPLSVPRDRQNTSTDHRAQAQPLVRQDGRADHRHVRQGHEHP